MSLSVRVCVTVCVCMCMCVHALCFYVSVTPSHEAELIFTQELPTCYKYYRYMDLMKEQTCYETA